MVGEVGSVHCGLDNQQHDERDRRVIHLLELFMGHNGSACRGHNMGIMYG